MDARGTLGERSMRDRDAAAVDDLWLAIAGGGGVGGVDGTFATPEGPARDARARGRGRGERRAARLSEPDAAPVMRFGAVDVGASGSAALDVVNDTAMTATVVIGDADALEREGFVAETRTVVAQPGTTERVVLTWTPRRAMAATYCGVMTLLVTYESPVPAPEVELKVRLRGVANGDVLRAVTNAQNDEGASSATKRPRDARLATRRSLLTSPQKKILSEDKATAMEEMRAKQRRVEDSAQSGPAPVARTLQLQRASEETSGKNAPENVSDDFQADIWLRQQELAFIAWLNHTIVMDDAGTVGEDAPSANRGDNASAREVRQIVRNKLTSLYSYDDELGRVLKKTYRHVDNARFRLNRGQTFMDNVALKDEFSRALSCYSPFWLQLGVDVVVGGGIACKHRGDLRELQEECIKALCRDRDLELEFGTGHTPGAPPYAHGYEEALCRSVLKRVLLLMFILDRAATSGLPPSTPLLMRPHAALKSSEDILRAALQNSMYGEGDIVRNLSKCTYKLHYKQNPIREYDFRCTNLAVDLRDGVRLCRLMEVLNADILFMSYDEKSKEWKRGLLNEVHFPCASRGVKIQNVEVALRAIKDQQVGLPGTWSRIKAEDIVDGHLEHTMGLLWALMMHYSAPGLLLPKALDAEIARLGGKVPDVRRIERLSAARRGDSVIEAPQCAMEARLFAWAKAACATQKVELNNLGSAFADGRALCALVRAYAPMMIPKRRISNVPLKLGDANAETAKNARSIARDNFANVCTALQALGGVPNPTFDIRFSNEGDEGVPDPRAVSGYLLFLSARLLLLRQQEVACIRIQRWWRWNRPNRPKFADVVRRWTVAATAIASHVRRVQASRSAEKRRDAIVTLQSFRRACVVRRSYMAQKEAAIKIQSLFRMHRARLEFKDILWATEKVQKMRRGAVQRRQFLNERRAASVIQGWFRTLSARSAYLDKVVSTMVIQAHWRGHVARVKVRRALDARREIVTSAAVKLQAAVRKHLVHKQFVRLRWAVVLAQARARAVQARRSFVKTRQATVTIQRNVRRFLDFNAYKRRSLMIEEEKKRSAAITIQRHWRGYIARDRFEDLQFKIHFVTLLQSRVRGWIARRKFQRDCAERRKNQTIDEKKREVRAKLAQDARTKSSAKRVSTAAKEKRMPTRSEQLRDAMNYNAAETIQRHARGALARRELDRKHDAAVVIQTAWRRWVARADFTIVSAATRIIQRAWRKSLERRRQALERHIVAIQAFVRGWLARKHAVHKLEWHRKRIKIATRVEPADPVLDQARKALAMVVAPHTGKDCVKGCQFFVSHWNNRTCRNLLASSDALHELMRNVHALKHSESATQDSSLTAVYAEHIPVLNSAYELFELVASEKRYAPSMRKYPELLFLEHIRLFQDDPRMLASAVRVMELLLENVSAKLSAATDSERFNRAEEILISRRATLRTTVTFFAKGGLVQQEKKGREELVLVERAVASLARFTRHGRSRVINA